MIETERAMAFDKDTDRQTDRIRDDLQPQPPSSEQPPSTAASTDKKESVETNVIILFILLIKIISTFNSG